MPNNIEYLEKKLEILRYVLYRSFEVTEIDTLWFLVSVLL